MHSSVGGVAAGVGITGICGQGRQAGAGSGSRAADRWWAGVGRCGGMWEGTSSHGRMDRWHGELERQEAPWRGKANVPAAHACHGAW